MEEVGGMVARYPRATWKPAVHHGYVENGQRLILEPLGVCTHSTDGPPGSGPDQRFFDPTTDRPGSTHFWINDVGTVWQMVELDEPAWGNGNDYSKVGGHAYGMPQNTIPIVKLFWDRKINPNKKSISIEFTGRGASRGVPQKLTSAQVAAWRDLVAWLKSERILVVNQSNLFFHSDVAATACPDGRFTHSEMLSYLTPEVVPIEDPLAVLRQDITDIKRILVTNGCDDADGSLLTGDAAFQHAKERGFSAILSGQRANRKIGELAAIVASLQTTTTKRGREALIEDLQTMIDALRDDT